MSGTHKKPAQAAGSCSPSTRDWPITLAILLLLLAMQLLSGILSTLSFERRQLETIVSGHDAVGANLAGKINRSLGLGKTLDSFIGLEALLAAGAATADGLDVISVVDLKGRVLSQYGLHRQDAYEWVADQPLSSEKHLYLRLADQHYLLFSLQSMDGSPAGFLCLGFAEQRLSEARQGILSRSLSLLLLSTLAAALLMVVVTPLLRRLQSSSGQDGYGRRQKLLICLILAGGQLAYCFGSVRIFQEDYLRLTYSKAHTIARLQVQDVESLLVRGLQIDGLRLIDRQLEATVARADELAWLGIEDPGGRLLYSSGPEQPPVGVESYPLHGRKGQEVGRLSLVLDRTLVDSAVGEIIRDGLTVAVLSLLVGLELLVVVGVFAAKGKRARPEMAGRAVMLMRPAMFLFIFASSLGYSFIPLYMAQLYQPVAGLSRELVLGLPLFLEMLGGGLALIPAGRWIDLKGWQQAFLVGGLLAAFGTLASGLATDQLVFCLARLCTGIGYGLTWMAGQGFVLSQTDKRYRAAGISGVVAGIYAGLICGNGIGALLADRLGYATVFLLAASLLLLPLLFALLFLRHAFDRPPQIPAGPGLSAFFRLLRTPQLLLIFCCSLLPYSMTVVALVYYLTPLQLHSLEARQGDIGRVIMVFGLCMIFLAPQISRLADRLADKRRLVIAGGLLGGFSLLTLTLPVGIWAVVAAVLLFGISVSISAASRNVISLALPVASVVGESTLMGMYRSVDKLGQSLGAVIPGLLLSVWDFTTAMTCLGGLYLLVTLLLALRLAAVSSPGQQK